MIATDADAGENMDYRRFMKEVAMKRQALIPNADFARLLGVKRQSMNTAVFRNSHYCNITPVKLPNGRLMWPADEVNRLIAGEIAPPAEVGDSAARLAAGKIAAKAKRLTAGEVAA